MAPSQLSSARHDDPSSLMLGNHDGLEVDRPRAAVHRLARRLSALLEAGGKPLRLASIAVVAAGLLLLCFERIDGEPIEKDAAQVTLMAFNLHRHGTISMDDTAPFLPSNYREPVPIVVSALGLAAIDARLGPAASAADYYRGERVRLLKYQNVFWLGLLAASAFWALRTLRAPFPISLSGAVLATSPFWGAHTPLNDLYTDIPAAALCMAASAALMRAGRPDARAGSWALAGGLFGILALVKAADLYVFAGAALIAALVSLRDSGVDARRNRRASEERRRPRRHGLRRRVLGHLLIMLAVFACLVAPWMWRNHAELGTWKISQRGGLVLMYRAVDDTMTREEYRGTFYLYAPHHLQAAIGSALGFSSVDLKRGGRLQRLNDEADSNFAADDLAAERAGLPELTLSFYRRARAERVRLEARLTAARVAQPEIAADAALEKLAFHTILLHPRMHVALTLPLLLRGATLALPALAIALAVALRRQRRDLLLFVVPASISVMLMALLTHFIGRYDLPALAVAVVALIASAWVLRETRAL